jgi:ADP-heptose:LPS heptosyltransferase
MEASSLFVGNDSGPMHIAAAVGTPVVGLFGPSSPEKFSPRGAPTRVLYKDLPCSPCGQSGCTAGSDGCMRAIRLEDVRGAVVSLIEEVGAGPSAW